MNVGVMATLWSADPLFMSISDYLIYGQKLKLFHIVGMFAIIGCSLVLSFNDMILGTLPELSEDFE